MPATSNASNMQMSVTMPAKWMFHVSSVHTFKVIESDRTGTMSIWVTPGWYKRTTSPQGIISLLPMRRWRLWRHRLLWGFSGLVDGR
jgi:hypothetical protein